MITAKCSCGYVYNEKGREMVKKNTKRLLAIFAASLKPGVLRNFVSCPASIEALMVVGGVEQGRGGDPDNDHTGHTLTIEVEL